MNEPLTLIGYGSFLISKGQLHRKWTFLWPEYRNNASPDLLKYQTKKKTIKIWV